LTDHTAGLRQAADRIRDNRLALPGAVVEPLALLLEAAARDIELCERQNSVRPDDPGRTRIMPHAMVGPAAALARAILGEQR
jgi:hypothetical protein